MENAKNSTSRRSLLVKDSHVQEFPDEKENSIKYSLKKTRGLSLSLADHWDRGCHSSALVSPFFEALMEGEECFEDSIDLVGLSPSHRRC